MAKDAKPDTEQPVRSSPRAMASLDVDVDVAGEKRRMVLVSRDIGAGGIFLRTDTPAPLWKKVKLSIALPDGKRFEIGGEVVRRTPLDKGQGTSQPAGMAVAFDEVSRNRRKELLAIVLDLCARRPDVAASPPSPVKAPAEPPLKTTPKEKPAETDPDALLEELDSLLDSVEAEMAQQAKASPSPTAMPKPAAAAKPPAARPPRPAPAKPANDPAKLRESLERYVKNLKGDTYYDILGVGLQASAKEIEDTYQRLLDRFKPPCSPDALPQDLVTQLSSVLGKVRKAFAILSKPDRKRAYDFLIDNNVDEG